MRSVIENADILSRYIQPVLDSVITGNFSLARVLPAIYAVDKQLINNHVMTLVSLLMKRSDTENMVLLNLFGLVAKDSPVLLEPSIPQLCECLGQQSTAAPTLQVLQDIAVARPKCLVDHMAAFRHTAETFPMSTLQVIQLMSTVGMTSADKSRDTLEYICDVVTSVDTEMHSLVFQEISWIIQKFPSLLNSNLINRLTTFEDSTSLGARGIIQEIRNEYNMHKIDRPQEKPDISKLLDSYKIQNRDKVTIVKVGGSKSDISSSKDIFRQDNEPTFKTSAHALPSTGGRVELTSVINKHGGSEIGVMTDRQLSVSTKDGSRSTGKLPTHRSMTRLNTSASRLETRPGLYKSMTRLDHSRYNSSNTVMVNSASSFQPPPYTAKTSITIPNSLGLNMPSSGSPTKSMSSGSMSASISLSTSNAPLSLPSQTSRRLAPNSSGPLTIQPPIITDINNPNNHSLGDIYLPNDSLGYSNNSSGSNTTNLTNLRWSEADHTKEVNLSLAQGDVLPKCRFRKD